MQEESLKRARAEERERETSEALAETKARLDQELSTVNFRLSAESMQLQHVLEVSTEQDTSRPHVWNPVSTFVKSV